MAPVTRSSRIASAQSVSDEPTLPQHFGSSTFSMGSAPAENTAMRDQQDSNLLIDLADLTDDDENDQSQASLQDFLQPLQDTAERVSRQVESFARRLDKFKDEISPTDQDLWVNAFSLLEEFTAATQNRLDHSRNRRLSRSNEDFLAHMEKIALERDLWILTKNLLLARSPDSLEGVSIAQIDRLKDLHRYSTTPELWDAFLDSDTIAQEYETILDWLHERADAQEPDIRAKIEETLSKSNRGDVRSAAPLFTSYEVKKKKRAIARDGPLENASNDGIVSQLDPDAPTRQEAHLDKQDAYYEEAAWSTCWEMLRRGMKLSEIRQWWDETNEPYRGVVLTVSDPYMGNVKDSAFLRIMNLATNTPWLKACTMAARNSCIADPVQRAVCGLLCGDSASSDNACESIDDLAYSLFNSLMIERYLHFVSAYRTKLEDKSQAIYVPAADEKSRIHELVRRLRSSVDFKEQIQSPHKLTELALIGLDMSDFLLDIGRATAQIAHETEYCPHLFIPGPETTIDDSARLLASDEDSVRVIAHLQIVLHSLGQLDQGYRVDDYIMENNIVNYMAYLQSERKLSLLPLYASKLSTARAFDVLGSTLVKVTDNKERGQLIRLMQKYNLDISGVISAIVFKANRRNVSKLQDKNTRITASRFTTSEQRQQTYIRAHFMNEGLSEEDENSIAAVEWYRWIDEGGWGRACYNIATLYKVWLVKGRYGALKALAERAKLADVSLAALSMNLMFQSDDEAEQDNGNTGLNDGDEGPGSRSPRKRTGVKATNHSLLSKNNTRAQLFDKSIIWLQLEQLVNAMTTLEAWQELADEVEANRDNPATVRAMKRELREGLDTVEAAVEPLLDQSFLDESPDPEDDGVLSGIRTHYLPEIVLGFNSALYFSGKAITRNNLTKCMDLANTVATTPSLTDAFVQSGRMRELVNAIALDSQDLLRANEVGGRKSTDKKAKGFDLWNVQWREMKDGTLEAIK